MTSLTVDQHIAAALADVSDDGDERWEHVSALHTRGGREVFEAAAALCRSADSAARSVGADILGQIGPWSDAPPGQVLRVLGDSPHRPAAIQLLLEMAESERDADALESVAFALGHLTDGDHRCLETLLALQAHHDAKVRHAVVHGLLGHEDDRAIAALIELTRDEDSDVRDWATFGLGSQIERDTPELREVLAARLGDPDAETHAEAVVGLAMRGDLRALDLLLALRKEDYDGPMADDALWALAAKTAHPALHDEVEHSADQWRTTYPGRELPEDLAAALAAYSSG